MELVLTRLHAFTNAIERKVRDLLTGEQLDPDTLNITADTTIYRVTFEAKDTP